MKLRYIFLYCILVFAAGRAYSQAPLTEFIENKGQWDDWIKYKATTPGGEVHLENDGLRYMLSDPENRNKLDSFHTGRITEKPTMKFHVYKVSFEGAHKPQIEGLKPQKHYYNYFLGKDESKWKSGIHPNMAINYNNLYDGITMYLSSNGQSLEYEFFVKPKADASQIKMKFDGPEDIRIKNGDLVISTSVGKVMELKPYAFQYINDEKVEVKCKYHLRDNTVTFDFPDGYDHSQQLIIDPIVFWCSFTGSSADNWGFTATYDNAGNMYLGGIVNCLAIAGGGTFPVSPGAYQTTFAGGQGADGFMFGSDIALMKLDPSGTTRIWATYLGGQNNERPHSLIVDPSDNLIVAGRTRSGDFPVTPGAYQATNRGGWDIIVTKLNASATALLGSTYIGGTSEDGVNFDSTEYFYGHLKFNYGDDARSEVQIDNIGNIYVAACTQSSNFPTTPGAISTVYGGGMQEGLILKFNSSLTSLLYSSFLGGVGDDAGYVLAFNKTQTSIYVAGGTSSPGFPVTGGTWQSTYQGDSADGFILKIRNSPPYNVQRGTFVGTSNFDQVYGIQVDDDGEVYVMGQSLGGTFPVTTGVYTNPNSCQFVMKMDSNLTTDLISTVYGSGNPAQTNISPVAFLVDTCNNVYISGWGGNIMGVSSLAHTGTTTGMPTTPDGHLLTTDGFDFYFIVFGPGLATLRYATFYGRNAPGFTGEHVDGGTSRFSKQGIIYQAICANCGGPGTPPFPTTPGAWSTTLTSPNCNEAGLKIAFNIGPVICDVLAGPSTNGCAPLPVSFTNLSTNGLTYLWDFGDGSPTTTTFSPSHTFTAAGVYTVTLSSANSNACFKTEDTFRLLIFVDTGKITPGFTYQKTDSCNPYIVSFVNTSTDFVGTPTYQWLMGDGTIYNGTTPPPHNYPDTGTYTVTLIMSDTAACKSPDTVAHTFTFSNFDVSANFTMPDSLCLGSSFTPQINFTNVTSTLWLFGDGQTTTTTVPTYVYKAVGTYTVTLIGLNPGGCGGGDTVTHIIKVLPIPFANFTHTPTMPTPNVPTKFTNLSVNATRYLWEFGDNTSGTEVNPIHQYLKTGSYKVCLTAYNNSDCPSMVCKTALAEVVPLLGLPTGFSPNGDGHNDILYVRHAAIKTMNLKIYNRWGQLVFETNDQNIGWDGTFNGQPQPIEAYAYVLNASFIDGTSRVLKGNVTLLR
ncbi:MAG: hypothetical protein K0Q79_2245 [Flavipsychrobacter sp.]|jgi:gliding motility-associated-like protein|nr:hypothetical protein [Flavipsychrobacter sp.]